MVARRLTWESGLLAPGPSFASSWLRGNFPFSALVSSALMAVAHCLPLRARIRVEKEDVSQGSPVAVPRLHLVCTAFTDWEINAFVASLGKMNKVATHGPCSQVAAAGRGSGHLPGQAGQILSVLLPSLHSFHSLSASPQSCLCSRVSAAT